MIPVLPLRHISCAIKIERRLLLESKKSWLLATASSSRRLRSPLLLRLLLMRLRLIMPAVRLFVMNDHGRRRGLRVMYTVVLVQIR